MFRPRPAYINTIKTRQLLVSNCATFSRISTAQANNRNQHRGWNYQMGFASFGLMMAICAATKSKIALAEAKGEINDDKEEFVIESLADMKRALLISKTLDLMAWMEPKLEQQRKMDEVLELVRKMEKQVIEKNSMDDMLEFIKLMEKHRVMEKRAKEDKKMNEIFYVMRKI